MSTSYLHSVLQDGAKAFLYRSGVCSLLGVPDSGGGEVIFSPTMPPVGFTYANSQFMGEPYIPKYLPDPTVSSALGMQGVGLESNEEIVPKGVQYEMPPPTRTGKITHSKISTRPASEQEKNLVELSEMPERPGTAFGRATIHIPGASERSQDFPSLTLPEQTEPLSNKAEEQSQHQLSPKDPRQSSQSDITGITRSGIVGPSTGTGVPVQSPPPGRERARVGVEHIGLSTLPLPSLPSSLLKDGSILGPSPRAPLEGEGVTGKRCVDTYAQRTGEKSTSNPSFEVSDHIDPGMDDGSSQAADRIEQFRTAVHELAAKKSPQREQTRDEAQPQQPQTPPSVQQVVIVRQPSNQARIPSAFWERSYLGRIRARILR